MKIGRNDPCICGSGKKYKKCCLPKQGWQYAAQEIQKQMDADRVKQAYLQSRGIFIRFVEPILFHEKKVWAIGSRVYLDRRPDETFLDFILTVLQETLGNEWWDSNAALSESEQHHVFRCFKQYVLWMKRQTPDKRREADGTYSGFPDGWTYSLITLAFDTVCLVHAQNLPDNLLTRLRSKNQYQGARYELGVAAMFARIGCKVEFQQNTGTSEKHCEFYAVHEELGVRAAVEAKSRHRQGVLHTPGEFDERKALKGDVQQLMNQALAQNPGDCPFLIFIDLNTPPQPEVPIEERRYMKDLLRLGKLWGTPSPENPDPFSAVFFTNYAGHYVAEDQAVITESVPVIPLYSEYSLLNTEFLERLRQASANVGFVPNVGGANW